MQIAIGLIVGLAILLTLISAYSLLLMRNAYELMHYSSPVVSLAVFLIAIAVWLSDKDWQSRLKVTLIAVLLFAMNSILTHATARAVRIRQAGHWEIQPEEQIPEVRPDEKPGKGAQ